MGKNVQFIADFSKLALAKKNSITLELPENTKLEQVVEIARMRGQRITVLFGDPQMELEFDEDEKEIQQPSQGMKVTADASGVVETVARSDTDEKEDESWLKFEDEAESEGTDAEQLQVDEDEVESEPEAEPGGKGNDLSFQPDWFAEQNTEGNGVA